MTDPHAPCSRALDQAYDRATAYHDRCLAGSRMLRGIISDRIDDHELVRQLGTVGDVLLGIGDVEQTERV